MATYRSFVSAQSQRNPNITNLLKFLESDIKERSCRLASLNFSSERSNPTVEAFDEERIEHLLTPRRGTYHPKLHGRIIVVEDLTRSIIETLGSQLQIDPLFFAAHLHSPWPGVSLHTPDMALLPSRLKSETFLTIHYHRTIRFSDPEPSSSKFRRSCNVHRKVMVLPKTKNVRVGLAEHFCTVFKTVLPDRTWICIVLVDPPLGSTGFSDQENDLLSFSVASSNFLGGYEDFLDPPPMTDNESWHLAGPTRAGMFDDLLYYWKRHQPEFFDPKSPALLQLAYYPLRIVAAEWVKYLTVMHYSITRYEYAIEDISELLQEQLDRLNYDLRSLQSWRRRSMTSHQKMRSIADFIRRSNNSASHSDHFELLAKDYDHLASSVYIFGQKFEGMLPVVTSMVQIVDSRRSLAETAHVNRLTFLAQIFVPLSFTTGLFSMNDKIFPGSPGFWVFFAVAVPVTVTVFLVAHLPFKKINQLLTYLAQLKAPSLPRYRPSSINQSHKVASDENKSPPTSASAGDESKRK